LAAKRSCKGRESGPDGLRLALLCLSWCSMSLGMQVLNKSVVASLRAPALIAAVQMLIAVIGVGAMSIKDFTSMNFRLLGPWMVVPLFFAAMLCTSTYTYQFISLSLMTVVRNLTPFIALPLERLLMPPERQPQVSGQVFLGLGMTLVGTLVYAGGMSGLSWPGIAFAVSNMVLAVCDRIIQRCLLTGSCKDLPSSMCTVVNNGVGMFPALILALGTQQISHLKLDEYSAPWCNGQTLVLLLLSGTVGIGICYLGFECQREISATSFFVLQNMSKVAVVIVGIVIFADPIKSFRSILGLALSIGGSFVYGWAQMNIATKPEATPLVNTIKKV